ncbi:hypothetical protein A4E84_02940 [Streptomyces qaidamensis]|uniref:Uncharacterized protein n=1 Tax=Streptomyces qaidamensis TaxID=1783515 RepID=A0A143BTI3_9ACTN|nr:hypothetical protein A4E84_02940 [Streptomyces qaidamensis]
MVKHHPARMRSHSPSQARFKDDSRRPTVMASSPDDTQRMAWEALTHSRLRSSVTYLDGLRERTETGHRGSIASGAHGELGVGDHFP